MNRTAAPLVADGLAVLLAQLELEDFHGGVLGQLVDEVHVSWLLVAGEPGAAPVDYLFLGEVLARLRDNHRHHRLAPDLVEDSDHGRLQHPGVLEQHVLYLGGVYVLAPADDHVLLAAHHVDEALLVLAYQVTRVEPAVLQGLLGRLGVAVVLLHGGRPAVHYLARLAQRHVLVVVVDHPHLHVDDLLADGGGLPLRVVRLEHGGHRTHLGLPEDIEELQAGERLLDLPSRLRREDGGAGEVDLERGGVVLAQVHHVDQEVGHHRDQQRGGDLLVLDLLDDLLRLEELHYVEGRRPRHADQGERQGRLMEEWRHELHPLVFQAFQHSQQLDGAVDDVHHLVLMGQHGTLGLAGGAGGVHDERRVVVVDNDVEGYALAAGYDVLVRLGVVRYVTTHADERDFGDLVSYLVYHVGELLAEDEQTALAVGQLVKDVRPGQTEVERHVNRPQLADREVRFDELAAVEEELGDLVAPADATLH